jgi:hypothetical protein
MTTRRINESVASVLDDAIRSGLTRGRLDATSRNELIDALLELRTAITDVIEVQQLEDTVGERRAGPRDHRARPTTHWAKLRAQL